MTNETETTEFDEDDDSSIEEDWSGTEEVEIITPANSAVSSAPARTMEDALFGGLPLLMIHKSHGKSDSLPALMREMHSAYRSSISLASVVRLPRGRASKVATFLSNCKSASIRIADPETFSRNTELHPSYKLPRQSLLDEWPYMAASQTATASWTAEVIDGQRRVGANLLLSPGEWAPGTNANAELAHYQQLLTWSRAAATPSEHVAVNMTLASSWLSDANLRDRLLEEIVESDESVFYIRVRWPHLGASYSQCNITGLLEGYRELCSVAEDEEKRLLFPNSDLTGWVSLAWGATGFGIGLGPTERVFSEQPMIRRKAGTSTPAIARYFEPGLLHTVTRDTHDDLANTPGYRSCPCRYCVQQRRRPAGTWDKHLANLHYLTSVADLTAVSTSGANRRSSVRRSVRSARSYLRQASSSVSITDASIPRHLAIWSDLLS